MPPELTILTPILGPVIGPMVVIALYHFWTKNKTHSISQEERDLLIEIKTEIYTLKDDLKDAREERHAIESRLNRHLENH